MSAASTRTLLYRLESRNRHDSFDGAVPWHGRLDGWTCTLEHGHLEASADRPFRDVAAARATLEPLLRDWEAAAFLQGLYEIRFRFEGTRPNEGSNEVSVEGSQEEPRQSNWPDEHSIVRRLNAAYPEPDVSFSRTPLVDGMLEEIAVFRRGEKPLPSVAQSLISDLTATVGDPRTLIAAFNIEAEVIERLRELANRGDPPLQPHELIQAYRGPEWQWMQEALMRLTLQAGRTKAGDPPTQLTMQQFRTRL
jgi:hypothetical protein